MTVMMRAAKLVKCVASATCRNTKEIPCQHGTTSNTTTFSALVTAFLTVPLIPLPLNQASQKIPKPHRVYAGSEALFRLKFVTC